MQIFNIYFAQKVLIVIHVRPRYSILLYNYQVRRTVTRHSSHKFIDSANEKWFSHKKYCSPIEIGQNRSSTRSSGDLFDKRNHLASNTWILFFGKIPRVIVRFDGRMWHVRSFMHKSILKFIRIFFLKGILNNLYYNVFKQILYVVDINSTF